MTTDRPLAVVGSGPIFAIARAIALETRPMEAFVVDVSPDAIHDFDLRTLLQGPVEEIDTFAAVGLHALNHARSDLVARMTAAGYCSARLVHPRAHVDASATVGENVLIAPFASVGPGCVVHDGALILDGARIEAGAQVGAYAWIGANVAVGFGAIVGGHTILRPGVDVDAGISVGHHCELATPGLRQRPVSDCTFESPMFDKPVRVYRGRGASMAGQ